MPLNANLEYNICFRYVLSVSNIRKVEVSPVKKAPKIDAPGVMDVWWPVATDILFFASFVFEINSFWFTSLTQTYQIRQQPLLLGELKNANILYGIWCRRPRGLHLVRGRLRVSLLDVRRGVAR